jgi:hypothetical protein
MPVAQLLDFHFDEGKAALPGYCPIPPTATLCFKTKHSVILVKFFGEELDNLPVLHKGSMFLVQVDLKKKACGGVDPFFPHVRPKFFGLSVEYCNTTIN